MSELDELERDLMQAADTWFNQALHQKLQRLIAIAREGRRKNNPFDVESPVRRSADPFGLRQAEEQQGGRFQIDGCIL